MVLVLVVLSRFVSIFGIFAALRLDARTAGVVAINLSQISEFSLVIVSLGAAHGHVSEGLESLVLYAMLLMSVTSTYTTLFNHEIATAIARALEKAGMPRWFAARREEGADESAPGEGRHDLFLLGVSREGLAFLEHLERTRPLMKNRIVAIDFNPETLERLRGAGVKAHYGDIANPETLQHAGIARATVVVSSISDWFLKGVDNRRLLQQARSLAPRRAGDRHRRHPGRRRGALSRGRGLRAPPVGLVRRAPVRPAQQRGGGSPRGGPGSVRCASCSARRPRKRRWYSRERRINRPDARESPGPVRIDGGAARRRARPRGAPGPPPSGRRSAWPPRWPGVRPARR